MGKDEDQCGVFCNSECRRDVEYQGKINNKDEEGSGKMCPGITMIPKDV